MAIHGNPTSLQPIWRSPCFYRGAVPTPLEPGAPRGQAIRASTAWVPYFLKMWDFSNNLRISPVFHVFHVWGYIKGLEYAAKDVSMFRYSTVSVAWQTSSRWTFQRCVGKWRTSQAGIRSEMFVSFSNRKAKQATPSGIQLFVILLFPTWRCRQNGCVLKRG